MVQDAKNNEIDQVWAPNTLSQTIQGNFYEQTPPKLEPKPCSRRSNSENDIPDSRLWIPPLFQNPNSVNDNPDRRQSLPSTPPQPNSVSENPERRQWIPSFSPKAISENDNSNRRQWAPPFSPKNVKLSESPDLKQEVRRNDADLKSVNSNQELDADDNNLQSSRSAITLNSPPLEFEDDHELSYLRELPSESRLPGFEPIFAPNSGFDINLSNDFFTAPRPPIKVNPSEDLKSKPLSDLQSKLLHGDSENDLRSAKPDLRSLDTKNAIKPEPATKCSNVNNTRRSFSSYSDDSTSESVSSDKELPQNYNDQYDIARSGNEKALVSVLYQDKNAVKDGQDENRKSLGESDKNKPSTYQSLARRARPQFNEARREMIEPTRGNPSISQSQLLLMQTERICYACSTANNPSCWAPDRRTTVKYCRKGNNACITKTFGSGSK